MLATPDTFSQWLRQAQIAEHALTAEQGTVLQAAFRFRQRQGTDGCSTRLLSHFLLHCGLGLKVAQIARLVGVSRPTASRQQGLSSKEAIQQARHRLDGRPYGKLLPRYAGPIAQFLCTHPKATRYDLLDFIDHTFGVRVSRIALYKFLKKYGLDHVPEPGTAGALPTPVLDAAPPNAGDAGRRAGRRAGPPLLRGHTQYAGAFLLMGQALGWLAVARACLSDDYGSLQRGFLTSTFALVVGLERVWHLDEMEDLGFALLTGGRHCPSRQLVGGWRRHLPWYEVDVFCRRTSPWHLRHGDLTLVSYDEHTVPRWTRKFSIRKGYVTTRNESVS